MWVDIFFKKERARLAEREANITLEVNQRVAQTLAQMDPLETLFKEFHGIFSEEHERVEDPLDEKGQLLMRTWAWQNRDHPAFKRLMDWIANTTGNETLKRAPVTTERILYGRAQISMVVLLNKEVRRLASAYEDMLNKKDTDFDSNVSVE